MTKQKKCVLVHEYLSTDDYELLTILNNSEVCAIVYRPPGGNCSRFIEFYECFLDFIYKNNFHLTYGGDFSINILEGSNTSRSVSGVKNLIATPTGITCSTLSCLDLLVTSVET